MDIEKTMQFIVEQQAQLTAKLEMLVESAKKRDEQIAKHDEQIAKHDQQIAAVTDLVGRLAQAGVELVERMNRLAESQAHSDRRVDTLVDIADKLMRRMDAGSKQ